jgi:hypothetical protein
MKSVDGIGIWDGVEGMVGWVKWLKVKKTENSMKVKMTNNVKNWRRFRRRRKASFLIDRTGLKISHPIYDGKISEFMKIT